MTREWLAETARVVSAQTGVSRRDAEALVVLANGDVDEALANLKLFEAERPSRLALWCRIRVIERRWMP